MDTNSSFAGTTAGFVETRRSAGIRFKVMLVFAVSLLVVFTLSAGLVLWRAQQVTGALTDRAARDYATIIADGVQTFGQTGDMTGLGIYLKNIQDRHVLSDMHVIRTPATIQDFKEREGAAPRDEADQQVMTSGQAREILDPGAHTIRYILPSIAQESCLGCHNVPKDSVLGVTSVTVSTAADDAAMASLNLTLAGGFLGAVVLELVVCFVLLTYTLVRPVSTSVLRLVRGARSIEETSRTVASFSQVLSQAAGEQAASIEQTSASLAEMAMMTRENAEHSEQAHALAEEARAAADEGRKAMSRMTEAITHITGSANETKKILKTIEEIAFQTNLLALNAAVEAARAGDAGRGFAVVAEEVRSLAHRSGEAARSTAELIQESQSNAERGVAASREVGNTLEQIEQHVQGLNQLIAEVASATGQLSEGIEQINRAVAHMQEITQTNADNTQRSVSVGENLSDQALELDDVARAFTRLVGAKEVANGSESFQAEGRKNEAPPFALLAAEAAGIASGNGRRD